MSVDGTQCISQWWWRGWLVGGQEGPQQSGVQFGVEDCKPHSVAGEPVEVAARDSGDQPVDAQAGQVVAPDGLNGSSSATASDGLPGELDQVDPVMPSCLPASHA